MDQDVEIEMKIKLYCRPKQMFELSVSRQTSLGEIVQVLKGYGDINDLPPVEKLKFNDHWKSNLTHQTLVGQLVPYQQQFMIQITYQQEPSVIQFYPQQSGFFVNQQSYSKILEQDSIEQKSQLPQKVVQQSQSQQLNQIKRALEQYPKKGGDAFKAIKSTKLKKIFNTFVQKLKHQEIQTQKSHDAYQSKLNTEKQLEIKQHKQEIKSLISTLEQQELKIQQLRRQMINKQQQIDNLKTQLNQASQNNNIKLEEQIVKFKAMNNDLQAQITELKNLSQDLKRQNQQLNTQIRQLKAQNQPKKIKTMGPILKQNSNIQVSKNPLCISQVLWQNDPDGTKSEFLLKSLQNFKQADLKKIKLVYKLDPENKTNFNNYIKGKTNLLILMHTENNTIFGAFLQKGLSEQQTYGRAFLFSLNQKAIYQKQNELSITHESGITHLIIGSADIVLNPRNKKVNINHLIFKQNSSFKNQDAKKYDIFTGQEDKTQLKVEDCEIYEAFFNK